MHTRMMTTSHIIYNLAILGKKNSKKIYWAIGLGALFPDTVTILFFFVTSVIQQLPHETIWRDLYFNSYWNNIFNLTHSFWLLPLFISIALYHKNKHAVYFFGSALIHSAMDFLVHAEDAYAHFFPLSLWRFNSPISYWNPAYHGEIVSIFEHIFVGIALFLLLSNVEKPWLRKTLITLITIESILISVSVLLLLIP